MSNKFECSICCEEYKYDKDNYIIDENNKKTENKIIICPKCGIKTCSECMINYFKSKNNFECCNNSKPKCDNIYDILFIYENFNNKEIEQIITLFKNKFLNIEENIINTTLKIKYKIAGFYDKIFRVVINSCNEELIKNVGIIVNDIDQNRYRELVNNKEELKKLIENDTNLINQLKKEVKDRLKVIFGDYLTYYINNELVNITGDNIMLSENNVDLIYEQYPDMKLYIKKEEFLIAFRSFYTFIRYFLKDNKNGINPLIEVFLFMVMLYERVDNINNEYIYYLKFFLEKEGNGYEIETQYMTFINYYKEVENKQYFIVNVDDFFNRYEIIPNYKNDWDKFNIIKLLFYYIDISSINIMSMLKQQKFMTCKNKNCDGDCFKYDNQIRCEKCNSIFCEKCFAQIYPEYINILNGTVIERIKNPEYTKYSKKQKNHSCKKEDLDTVKLIYDGAKHCPICNELVYKTGGCDDMFCYNCWMNGKKTLFKWKTMELTKTTTNELFNHLMHSNGQQQARFEHPDAQRLRARGATIDDIINEYYKDDKYYKFKQSIKFIQNLDNITYNNNRLFDNRIKYMFNFSNTDIKINQYLEFKPKTQSNNYLKDYEFTPEKVIISKTTEDTKYLNLKPEEKKEYNTNIFKNKIYGEYVYKYFYENYAHLLNQTKENILDIIYTVKEDTFDNKHQKPLIEYINDVNKIIKSYNDKINILKHSYPFYNHSYFINDISFPIIKFISI